MPVLKVEVSERIAKKFNNKSIITYNEIIEDYENEWWTDLEVNPNIEMKDFYNLLLNSNGWEMD